MTDISNKGSLKRHSSKTPRDDRDQQSNNSRDEEKDLKDVERTEDKKVTLLATLEV